MSSRFEDERGVIEDLLVEPLDSVTRIFTKAGEVRGNHVHMETVQFTYVISGMLQVVTREGDTVTARIINPGEMAREGPGVPHAWRALGDTTVLVFTRGPRRGEGYESDTIRLMGEDKLL